MTILSLPAVAGAALAQAQTDWGSCRSYCSQTEIGNSLVEIRIVHGAPTSQQLGPRAELPAVLPEALEITTYAEGFARGRSLTLPLRGAPAQARRAEGSYATSRKPLPQRRPPPAPGLESIAVRSVVPESAESPLSLAPDAAAKAGAAASLVTLDQAEPGRTYFIRPASSALPPLSCQAAICPMDLVQPPTKARSR